MGSSPGKTVKSPIVTKFSDIETKETDWLWPGKVPAGMLSLFVGDQDTGKSTLTLYMAAIVSKGGYWPGGPNKVKAKSGAVIILTTEDDINRTVKPRLEAAGADMEKIITITGIEEINEAGESVSSRRGLYNLTEDKDMLIQTMTKVRNDVGSVRLVILDPISAYIGGKNANSNSEVREFLSYLTQLADVTGAAVVGINHLNKDNQKQAAYRTLGSVAWTATARAVWLVAKDPDDEDRRIMSQIKCNLARDKTGLAFRLVDTVVAEGGISLNCPRCEFEQEVVFTSADELLDVDMHRAKKKKQQLRDATKKWLKDLLAKGPQASKIIWGLAKKECIPERSLDRAKIELKVQITPLLAEGKIINWQWSLGEEK